MERDLLLTVSDDMSSLWSLRFVASFFTDPSRVRCTVLYVASAGYASDDVGDSIVLSARQMEQGHAMVERARQWLLAHGFSADRVTPRVVGTQFGVVRDIVSEAHKGLYDAVVVGRRYLDWVAMLYTESVSRGLLWNSVDVPVWVCNQPEPGRRNILLCSDGSDSALSMADHVGFMMAEEPEHTVTILHLRTQDGCAPCTVDATRERILENGVAASRISSLVTDGQDKVETIMRLAHEGRYAVVAVGRRPDLPERLLPRLFHRSVSLGLHEQVSGFSLWVSR